MFRRHVDFFAVFVIAAALIAAGNLPSLRMSQPAGVVRLQSAVNDDGCRVSQEILSRLADLLNQ